MDAEGKTVGSFAHMISQCPEEDFPILRELMILTISCPHSYSFERDESGKLIMSMITNPMHWSRQIEFPWVIRHGDFQPHHEVLEIGAGVSPLQYYLARRTGRYHALEYDVPLMNQSAATARGFGLGDKILHVRGDARALPFSSDRFDRVVCVSVLEHVEGSRREAVQEAVRVLKPGGVMLLTMDVILEGSGMTQDMLGQAEALEILNDLGIGPAEQHGRVALCRIDATDLLLTVVMIRFEKPGVA